MAAATRRLRWAKALWTFALLATPAQTASADTIETLVARLRREAGSEGATDAALKLANLADKHADNQATIAAAGAIEPLVALVRGGSEGAKEEAARALWILALNNDNQVKIALAGGFWPMMMQRPIGFLLLLLLTGHLLTLHLYAAAAKALYGAAQGTPTTPWFSKWTTDITLFVEFLVMQLALGNAGLLEYARYTAWRAIPPALCIAGARLYGPSAAMAATAWAVAHRPRQVRQPAERAVAERAEAERREAVERERRAAERAAAEQSWAAPPSAPPQHAQPEQQDARDCVVCMAEPRTIIFEHQNGVRHALCCAVCAPQLQARRMPCPTCRQPLGRMVEAPQTIRSTNYATRPAAVPRQAAAPPPPPASPTPAASGHRSTDIPSSDLSFGSPRVELGQGAFGVVYRASWQGADVAVKALRTGGALLPQQELTALLEEAAVLASLRHPNVVGFLGICLDSPTEPMLVTEFVSGGSLEGRLYPHQGGAQALTLAQRRRVASGVAAGLVHIHSKPLVHRDLKPGNVLLTADLTAKVADVGLARALHGTQAYMTGTGATGTPVYMAPEQWEEERLTAKVDVYAFGVMLNEMETATRPWQGAGNMMAIGRRVCRGDRPTPVARGAVGALIARCWAAGPEQRPAMEEVVRELSQVLV